MIISAVLITGGFSDQSSELYHPLTGASCRLPKFPDATTRYYHTVDNHLLCGGHMSSGNCLQWSPVNGTWESFTLNVTRYYHVSWTPDTDNGTYLMGGSWSWNSTTLIKPDGSQEEGFGLKYETL